MRDDQFVRIACGTLATIAYSARITTLGNGPVTALGYEIHPFTALLALLLLLAIPETIDKLPIGPSRS